MQSEDKIFDFIIIGGGIAGRLFYLAPEAEICLVEAESQAGYHATGRSAAMYVPAYHPQADEHQVIFFITRQMVFQIQTCYRLAIFYWWAQKSNQAHLMTLRKQSNQLAIWCRFQRMACKIISPIKRRVWCARPTGSNGQ